MNLTPSSVRRPPAHTFLAAVLLLGAAGCGIRADDVTSSSPASHHGVRSLPSFTATYELGTWTEGSAELIRTMWTYDYESADAWAKESFATSSPGVGLTRVELRDGVVRTSALDRNGSLQGEPTADEANGPTIPDHWLKVYDLDRLTKDPARSVERHADGSARLVETTHLACNPPDSPEAISGPAVYVCSAGADTITAETTVELDPDGIPRTVSVEYDGKQVGSVFATDIVVRR